MQIEPIDLNLGSLKVEFDNKLINLRPEAVQRNFIWSLAKQQKLVDTILRGWHIPPVHVRRLDPGGQYYEEVLDGQQRLTTIKRFLEGELKINGFIKPESEIIKQLNGMTFNKLPPRWQTSISSQYTLRKIVLHAVSDPEASEIFQRLNMGIRMEAAELRNSIAGPIRNFVKYELAKRGLFQYKLIGIGDNNRFNYDDLAAKMLFFVKNNGLNMAPKASNLLDWYRAQNDLSQQTKNAVQDTLQFLATGLEAHNGLRFNVAVLLSVFWAAYEIRRNFRLEGSPADFIGVIKEFESWRLREKRNKEQRHQVDRKADQFNEAVRAHTTDVESFKLRDSILQETLARNLRLVPRAQIRAFPEAMKQEIYSRDRGICYFCGEHVTPDNYEAHHIIEWAQGGLTATENGACSHRNCNRKRTFVSPPREEGADVTSN